MSSKVEIQKTPKQELNCGLVMPISALDGYSAEHWSEVKNILIEAIEGIDEPTFRVRMVSDADDVGVIQKRIVQNIYSSDIIVCDVSGKNPNVMFELGMRLAFDKPTVIIKDDKTDYAFDTGIIEHVPYPRDLRFARIVAFKTALAEKVAATYRASKGDSSHSTFLKNFGKFQVANLTESVVPADKLTLELVREMQEDLHRMRRDLVNRRQRPDLDVSQRSVDSTARISFALARHLLKNPSVRIGDLLGDDDIYEELKVKLQAPKYFSGPSEFKAAVDEVIKTMALSDEQSPKA